MAVANGASFYYHNRQVHAIDAAWVVSLKKALDGKYMWVVPVMYRSSPESHPEAESNTAGAARLQGGAGGADSCRSNHDCGGRLPPLAAPVAATDGSIHAWGHSDGGGTGAPSGIGFTMFVSHPPHHA